jgi:hypothetical protein
MLHFLEWIKNRKGLRDIPQAFKMNEMDMGYPERNCTCHHQKLKEEVRLTIGFMDLFIENKKRLTVNSEPLMY